MKKHAHFQTAKHIMLGSHVIKDLKEPLGGLSDSIGHALIVTQGAIQDLGFTHIIEDQLLTMGAKVDVNIDILPEPTIDNIEEVYENIQGERYDVVIGIGGGSVLDATKILAVLMTNSLSVENMLGTNQVEKPGVPTILIPTTSGTGSEVTPNAIVTLPDEELKVGIVSQYLLPNLVVLDPSLTLSLPKSITAATGMDAFTHSLESFISNKANPFSDMFALESIRLISSSILIAYENGSSIEAREKMLVGSMYGGMALTAAGTAAVHALAYPLGGKYHIPHGEANSMLLPHVMNVNMDAIIDRLNLVAEPMGLSIEGKPKEKVARDVVELIETWTAKLNIPQNIADFGVTNEDLDELAVAASKVTRLLNNNPKELTIDDIKSIYQKLLP
ncbi:iron-containing alcohol dehydrogenase [Salipaludibacillus agaradhaerens]|uniref:Iron-containing alcohol dehydrogenase n=1 Tax=Salipaludibacillus agaradhaerens TaxID=76935 RepID=A0A9Q4B4P0_SALAG|nr:iron-containing alcohol dehydrogenase [Salipaludibacillus agaradhaerens]MCR6098241.1 iron-containing alcohol dehydrogenase [Salipaludibacillus agaradhaerens]MCR6104902.1 iron-containing alcohol dehydrogenase [Salipaludibacillus agaradhaerens]MCR6116129.1 iron-containing alcohol dehydrogenase [Salipaludibacillus agaradhaerens]MCR6116949.1 iron-containing alcohol dehydrogenase [Salipaludibacillus agaradhaerens]